MVGKGGMVQQLEFKRGFCQRIRRKGTGMEGMESAIQIEVSCKGLKNALKRGKQVSGRESGARARVEAGGEKAGPHGEDKGPFGSHGT